MLQLLKKFRKSESGAFLPMFGIIIFPLLTMVLGATVDYARMNNLQSRMQSASDIALIAATKTLQSNKHDKSSLSVDDQLTQVFKPFFQANMKLAGHSDFKYTPTYNSDENTSSVTVTAKYEPIFMQMFGYNTIDVAVDLTINLKVEENFYVIDIVMCLDATGSMQNTLNAAVANANSFNNDLRKELGMEDDPNMKVRVRPMFYRDWQDAIGMLGLSPLDGGTSRTPHHNAGRDVFKYTADFIDLDPSNSSQKAAKTNELKTFLNSENAAGGGDLPEAGATCINQGTRSNWYDAKSANSRKYFNLDKDTPINTPHEPNNVNITVVPVVVFWTDASISDPAITRQYIDSTQPGNWPAMKKHVWDNELLIDQTNKILVLFGPDPGSKKSGYQRAYDYFKSRYPSFSHSQLHYYANLYRNHSYFTPPKGWTDVSKWNGFAYGGSLASGNSDGAKIIGKKIKEKLPDLLRIAS